MNETWQSIFILWLLVDSLITSFVLRARLRRIEGEIAMLRLQQNSIVLGDHEPTQWGEHPNPWRGK